MINDLEKDLKFRETVIAQLSSLHTGQKSICDKLDAANVSIANLYEKAAESREALLAHVIQCPQIGVISEHAEKINMLHTTLQSGQFPGAIDVRNRLENLERITEKTLAVQNAVRVTKEEMETQKNRWIDRIVIPAIKIIGLILLVIAGIHINSLLKLAGL
jgi:uncharacterized coiled-coil protein SlyX